MRGWPYLTNEPSRSIPLLVLPAIENQGNYARELKYQNVFKIERFETLDDSTVDNEFNRRTLCVELCIIHNLWVFQISNEQLLKKQFDR